MWKGSSARASPEIERPSTPRLGNPGSLATAPSWTRTTWPSAVTQASVSMPVAPMSRASENASSVFSRAWALAPR